MLRAEAGARIARQRRLRLASLAAAAAALFLAGTAFAQEASEWLQRAAEAARSLTYSGTLVYQHGGRVETSRVLHLADAAGEHEKLINLEGPPREVVRNNEQIRCYYPDAKIIRVESRNSRNAFPSLLPQQQETLEKYYSFRRAESARIAGLETEAFVFQPKDGLRYGHKLWADAATGLLIKAQLLNERGVPIEQFAFTDIQIGAKIERDMVRPTFAPPPPDWQMRQALPGDVAPQDTGWQVKDLPPGFTKLVEGYRTLRGKPAPVAHLVFSDGLVAISVFVEPTPEVPQQIGLSQQGGVNVYSRQLKDHLVTVLGETPGATVRQMAYSVAHR
ncbi:MAG TPA: MucB/RseB C-terminal domain-containing protein [Casimicrobiaceae bacterium]|nr:MucB/RseB C-terminal domain-containing protein [Casimicrobiaceae bacterium]